MISAGFNLYPNPGVGRPIIDTYSGSAGMYLNSAITSVSAATLTTAALLLALY
jgi:hypothetical protein